jgi:acyl-CoA reductase-like NAD-dependent aldehyde dehydrogenase
MEKVLGYIALGQQQGANLITGGKRAVQGNLAQGAFVEPTIFTHCTDDMAIVREEIFGPVLVATPFDDIDDVVRQANDTRYGLTAGVFTKDEDVARALLSRVNAGSVYWNCCDRVSPRLPWSGVGDSGIGLTLSTHGIQTFTRPKAWHLRQPA